MKPTDPLYANQWHFNLLGDIEKVWDDYTGDGVKVGVYDDGLQYTHADLNDNYDASLHFKDGNKTYDPMPLSNSDGHGTSVAGIIAAEANGIGGVGVAHGASITGVNFLSQLLNESDWTVYRRAFDYASTFDVMSNSWGYSSHYNVNQYITNNSSAAVEAGLMRDVAAEGRDGLGTIVVKAAGNSAWNAAADGLNNSRHIIVAAAASSNGGAAYYTNFGQAILVSAGAAQYTTDITGSGGYNSGDYMTSFSGTSASTPVISGVAALMLEANSGLGWRDVKEIMASSAQLTGSGVGNTGTGYEQGSWSVQETGSWNGGGHAFHRSYGFGLVDAYAAVRMAEVWTIMQPTAKTSANETSASATYSGSTTLTDNGTVTRSVTISSAIEVEHVYVTLNNLTHARVADLVITLIAPDGTEMIVMNREGAASLANNGYSWTFGINGARGIDAQGTWQLKIEDKVAGSGGSLGSFKVEVFGATNSNNDLHHFTDDFQFVAALDGRSTTVLNDTNGGSDWLNFAGVTGNVSLDMNAGGVLRVNGTQWASIANGTAFENAMMGDGNDTINGNALENTIYGMRGNDTINGGDGNDIIYGGDGDDIIDGGGHFDWIDAGAGNDIVTGGWGRDTVYLGDGDDIFYDSDQGGWFGSDVVYGGNGNDVIHGRDGDDEYYGGDGNDTIYGGKGNDVINGGNGYDIIHGGNGNDTVWGGDGRDMIYLGDGNDIFYDNAQTGWHAADVVYGHKGNDRLNGGGGDDRLFGGEGDDYIEGGDGDDYIDGGDQFDIIFAGAGNDTVLGGNGRDTVDLGDGDDVFHDNAQGGWFGADVIFGGAGNDIINGGGGDDRINGGTGNDVLTGGADADAFEFNANFGHDRVSDFTDNVDTVWLDAAIWGGNSYSAEQVVSMFASVVGQAVVFAFGGGQSITFDGITNTSSFIDDISFL